MLLGSTYRPGPHKNLVFAIYSACAVLGFFAGIFVTATILKLIGWAYYFWVGSYLVLAISIIAYFTVPFNLQQRRAMDVKMD